VRRTGAMLYLLLWILVPKEDPAPGLGAGAFRSA
jgi:hypothetical protein